LTEEGTGSGAFQQASSTPASGAQAPSLGAAGN
jgi:hypothetical protein